MNSSAESPSEREPLLELIGIDKTFRRPGGGFIQAAKAVNLTVRRGEAVALVGESGSGKSTLGRIALCLLRPDAGKVMFAGECLSDMRPRELRAKRIGMQPIFQDPAASFNPRRSVADLLAQALIRRGAPDPAAQAIALLEDVGLRPGTELLHRFPHELSGGQRQRLAIARALAMQPALLIADEPLSGADVSIRGQILNLLVDLQEQRGLAYLIITHDISIARAFAHRIAVMKDGEIVESGSAREVLDAPRNPYTSRLVAAVPMLPPGPLR
jgi:ABC-type glutathione transport system ATPase component